MDGVGEIHAHTLLHYLGVQYLHFFLVVSHSHLLKTVVCPLQLNYEQNDTARGEAIMLKFWMIMLCRTARKVSLLCSRIVQLCSRNVHLCSNFH